MVSYFIRALYHSLEESERRILNGIGYGILVRDWVLLLIISE